MSAEAMLECSHYPTVLDIFLVAKKWDKKRKKTRKERASMNCPEDRIACVCVCVCVLNTSKSWRGSNYEICINFFFLFTNYASALKGDI